MQSKSLLIAIAAFAVTATGVQAYGGMKVLERAGLSEEQISAFETARELKESGDLAGARDALLEAGVDEDTLRSVHEASKEMRDAMHAALEEDDYEAFREAVKGTPLAEVIDTEADFEKFVEAHELKEEGNWAEAKEILDELGVEPQHRFPGHRHGLGHQLTELSDDQRDAFQVARKANDREAMKAILDEAGIEIPPHHRHH
ncbi:MAG TPA: hypothetical protein VGE31_02900 [Candidatus Paceibacterota bacterium]